MCSWHPPDQTTKKLSIFLNVGASKKDRPSPMKNAFFGGLVFYRKRYQTSPQILHGKRCVSGLLNDVKGAGFGG
jgi:hypothetical protein